MGRFTARGLTLLLVSCACGLFATLIQLYMFGFVMDLFVPVTVDHSPKWRGQDSLGCWPLFNNSCLLLLFWIQHSAMPRGPLKKLIQLCITEDYYRPLYTFVSSLQILLIYYFWIPIPVAVWDLQIIILRMAIYCISAVCWFGTAISLLTLDPLGLLGIREPLCQLLGWKSEVKLVKTGLYGMIRHPVYSFLILSVWITPTMTIGHLLLSIMFTLYILLAVSFYEEPDLLKKLGPGYEEYVRTTPAYVPRIRSIRSKCLIL